MAFYRAKRASGGGGNVATGTVNFTTSNTKVTTNFKPKYIAVAASNGTSVRGFVYNEDISTTKYLQTASGSSAAWGTIGSTGYVQLVSVSNDGFTVKATQNTYTGSYNYFVMG